MSVLSSLTDALDQLFGVSPSHDNLSEVPLDWTSTAQQNYEMNGNSIFGIEGADYAAHMEEIPGNPFDLDTGAIYSITQKKSPAFNVVDIDPFGVAAGTAIQALGGGPAIPSNQVNISKIIDKIGNDFDLPNQGFSQFGQGWFTVTIPIPGNFLKMEFLPSPVGGSYRAQPNTINNYLTNRDQTILMQTTGTSISNDPTIDLTHSAIYRSTHDALAGYKHLVFIQFDDNNGPLHLLKPDSCYKTPFSTIYLTFRRWCPKFSITTGFNTEIIPPPEHRAMNANPAFGPGYGLWDYPSRHCTTFCFNSQDQNVASANAITVNSGTTTTKTLFQNNLNGTQNATSGLVVGWITNIDLSMVTSTANAAVFAILNIFIQRGGAAGDVSTKLICSIPVLLFPGSSTGQACWNYSKNYSTPRRFVLKPNDKLQVNLRNDSNPTVIFNFAIEGYMFGRSDNNDHTGTFPGYNPDVIYQNPFPLDYVEGQL